MKPVTDEMLMAYADGELEAPARAELERAMATDSALAERVRAHAALRARLQAAFAPELDEPLPERLRPPAPAGEVVDLAAQRARRAAPRPGDWWRWGGLAAGLLLGVLIGRLWPAGAPAGDFETRAGRLLARGAVAQALSTQRAAAPPADARVAVQLSFVDRAGAFCRTFSTGRVAGLACRDGADWAVQVLAEGDAAGSGAMRQAASALPPAVLAAVDQRSAGRPLDAQAEEAALQGGWQR